MKFRTDSFLGIFLIAITASLVSTIVLIGSTVFIISKQSKADSAPLKTEPPSSFAYAFNSPGILQESTDAAHSSSPYWFLDSGGKFSVGNGFGETIQGSLPLNDRWRLAYARSSATDTDGGAHPQNLFRLVTKSTWENSDMEAEFKILRDNLSISPNRNESNGLLLMLRYESADTLYYAGIRVDGTAVIKKKYDGIYYTMTQTPAFSGTYDRYSKPNLLPHNLWIGLRASAETQADHSVLVKLYMQTEENGWSLLASAVDRGQFGNTPPITEASPDGIRTDFMDVLFQNISIHEIVAAPSHD